MFRRFAAPGVFTIFAFIALVLSAVGIYAAARQAPSARQSPASAASRRRGLVQLSIGLTLGVILAWFASSALQSLVVQIPTRDPVTFGTIIVLLVVVTLIACLVPARRAMRLDPLAALRD